MAENTKIEWATHTFNPWIGCTKISPACDNCYAAAWDRRFAVSGHAMHWGAGVERRRTSESNWKLPLKWNREAEKTEIRPRVFCSSLADVFDNEVPYKWRADLFALISQTPNLDWLLLTKRIGNARSMLRDALININLSGRGIGSEMMTKWVEGNPPQNVWLGATICTQEEADRDIPKLLAVPAAKRFLSMEPLLGPVGISDGLFDEISCRKGFEQNDRAEPGYCINCNGHKDDPIHRMNAGRSIDWVIVGGESGLEARPMHPDWARSLRDQCQAAGVPFLFKQWGEWCPESVHCTEKAAKTALYITLDGETRPAAFGARNGATTIQRVGKKNAGRLLDGRTWDEVPV